MDNLKKFFNNNDVRIGDGKDFTTTPPVYYSSLNEAFLSYFKTFRDKKDTFHFIFDIRSWKRESLAFDFSATKDNVVFSILGFHRFIELLLKDILRRINPFLAVKFLQKEEEIFKFFDNKMKAEDIKTIEYNESIKRLMQAFKHYNKSSEIYTSHLKDYEFLLDIRNIETLRYLTEWRNRIMHNGTTLPNLFAFEYLVSQRLIPLINDIIQAEKKYLKNYKPPFFKTLTGIKIIDEILDIKFEFTDFNNITKSEKLAIKLLKLGHIKEIGRAAFNNKILILNNISYYESYYENPIDRVERFAESEKEHKYFYNLRKCLCCGLKSLVVYRKEFDDIFTRKRDFISWFKCYNCDYSLKNNVGDPNFFGISDKPIFATK